MITLWSQNNIILHDSLLSMFALLIIFLKSCGLSSFQLCAPVSQLLYVPSSDSAVHHSCSLDVLCTQWLSPPINSQEYLTLLKISYSSFRSLGYLTGSEDYITHVRCWEEGDCGLDFRNNMKLLNQSGYSTHMFANRAESIIRDHSLNSSGKVSFSFSLPCNVDEWRVFGSSWLYLPL